MPLPALAAGPEHTTSAVGSSNAPAVAKDLHEAATAQVAEREALLLTLRAGGLTAGVGSDLGKLLQQLRLLSLAAVEVR
jgi:hypothetical protein